MIIRIIRSDRSLACVTLRAVHVRITHRVRPSVGDLHSGEERHMNAYNAANPDRVLSMDEQAAALVHLPTSARALTRKGHARDHEALRLKALGFSLEEIAAKLQLGGDPRRAAAAIKRALGGLLQFAHEEHRMLELVSLDELECALWRQLRKNHLLVDHGKVHNATESNLTVHPVPPATGIPQVASRHGCPFCNRGNAR